VLGHFLISQSKQREMATVGLFFFSLISTTAFAVAPLNLMPQFNAQLLEAMSATELVGPATKAIPGFVWTIEYTRPLKTPKLSRETYNPLSLHGLAQSRVEVLNDPDAKPSTVEPKPSYTLRGLERVQEPDTQISFSAPGLTIPPAAGKKFDLTIVFEKQRVTQQCVVGTAYLASKILAALPGSVVPIVCKGATKYLGMNVSVISTVLYFDALGMFLNEIEDIQSPFGPVQLKKKIIDFALTK
jgi:hypothetical protein